MSGLHQNFKVRLPFCLSDIHWIRSETSYGLSNPPGGAMGACLARTLDCCDVSCLRDQAPATVDGPNPMSQRSEALVSDSTPQRRYQQRMGSHGFEVVQDLVHPQNHPTVLEVELLLPKSEAVWLGEFQYPSTCNYSKERHYKFQGQAFLTTGSLTCYE